MTLTEYTEMVSTAKLLGTPLESVINPHPGQEFVVVAGVPYQYEIVSYIRPLSTSPNWHWFQLRSSFNQELFLLEYVMPYEPERNG